MYIKKRHEVSIDDTIANTLSESDIEFEKLLDDAVDLDRLSTEILRKLNTNEYDLYIDYFVNNISVSGLATKYDISITATTTRIYRLKKKIKSIAHSYFIDI